MTLSQKRAQDRFTHIKTESVSYRFHLILQAGTHYDGFSQIDFTLNSVPSQLVLDCKAKQVKILIINQKHVQELKHEDGFLFLNTELLKQGPNHVAVAYRNKYDNDGNGCVSFIDVDKKQYIYTQFQPYYANRVFVLFDQPDLKASMQLSIIYPVQFERVISNQYATFDEEFNAEQHQHKIDTKYKKQFTTFIANATGRISVFPSTKLLPTYLYCFVAGPYKQLELKQTYKNIPMSLYCIESLFKYMEGMADFIFEITIECMKFFEQFFGVEYPFAKYDQVFAHEYKCGAMENAAIVTFNDQYIWKQKVSTQTMFELANVISHQLSHHWFGDLSTMKWWDDLWLNQSFAEFISHFCLQKIKNNLKTIKYESSMASFLASKAWGYHEDQLTTTHPIRGQVPNTLVAASIFDGITYAKGAATMKQLLLLMGEDNFSKGLCAYFKKYGFKNATLQQFIAELQVHFKSEQLTLQQWQKLWLETASLNQLQPKWDPLNQSQQATIQIIQTPFTPQYATLRPHKIKIGLFKQDCSIDVIEVFVEPVQRTIVKYNGSNKYKALLLNYEDHTFAKVVIDETSLAFFSSGNLVRISDTLTRTLIWRSFYDMVKDGIISSMKYIDTFQNNISKQSSDSIFQRHFEYVHAAINTYTPKLYRDQLNIRIFYFILSLIQNTQPSQQNRLVILKTQLCNYSHSLLSVRILLAWRQDKFTPLKGHQMTIVQKWKCVVHAFEQPSISKQQKMQLLEDQLKLDESDTAKIQSAKCQALISSQQQFEKLYESFKDPHNQKSITMKREIVRGWNNDYHQQRLKKYKNRYFQEIIEVSKAIEGDHFQLFLQDLSPVDDDLQQNIKKFTQLKFGQEEKYDKIRRDTSKIIGDLQRRLKAYKRFEAFNPL